jgi:hypothetical protein
VVIRGLGADGAVVFQGKQEQQNERPRGCGCPWMKTTPKATKPPTDVRQT